MVKLLQRRNNSDAPSIWINRGRYIVIWVLVAGSAWLYGERILYVSLTVLTALPIISYIIAAVGLMSLWLDQKLPASIGKEETGEFTVTIINPIRIPFGRVLCVFYRDGYAIDIQDSHVADVGSFRPIEKVIHFSIGYRGEYIMGIESVQTMDLTGLFKLTRKLNMEAKIIALPGIADMSDFPITSNLLTQAQSRHDIRDEDYSSISDIRPYLPTDSIKRVHWKLTAKRNEWLVKNFQSNALHHVAIIVDSKRIGRDYPEQIRMEDQMIEISVGLALHCLRKGMPVEYMAGEGQKAIGRMPADFEVLYRTASHLLFEEDPRVSTGAILGQCLNEAAGYINAIILTARLDSALYERIANAQNNGHNIAVLYFAARTPNKESENVFRLLEEGSGYTYRISPEDYEG